MMHPLSAGTSPLQETRKEVVPQHGKEGEAGGRTLIKESGTHQTTEAIKR
jgi:hypothetical protein